MTSESFSNGADSADVPMRNDRPVLLVELLHLIAQCITDLYKTEDGQVAIPPGQPCVDFCILAEKVFRTQIKLRSRSSPENNEAATPVAAAAAAKSARRAPRISTWHCLLDAVLSKETQLVPYFNLVLQVSENCISSNVWMSTSATSDGPFAEDKDRNCNMEYKFTPNLLASLTDKLLFFIKRLVVLDAGLPSPWLRSVAIDFLLSCSSAYTPVNNNTGNVGDWQGGGASDEDELSIEGLGDEDPDVMDAFRNFLHSSGQQ